MNEIREGGLRSDGRESRPARGAAKRAVVEMSSRAPADILGDDAPSPQTLHLQSFPLDGI